MCHKTLFLSISAPPSLPQQNRTAPPSQTKPSLHLPLCLIGANKLLNTKRLKSSASRPPLLAIKFSHSNQRCRQVAGIVAELARTMAKNGVAIPSDENDAPTSVSDALCLIGASKLLNTKRLKSSASRPPLLSIKFSHSDQRRRQVAGIVAEHVGTMAKNDVAIPSLLVPP